MAVLLCGTEVRFVSGVGEEVDEGYLETNTNLVSVVSSLCAFSLSYQYSCWSDVPNSSLHFRLLFG